MAAMVDWHAAYAHVASAMEEAVSTFPLSYTDGSALGVALQLLVAVIVVCLVASVLAQNYSYVDRLWFIVPFVYVWHFAVHAYLKDGYTWNGRLVLMAVLSTAWGLRLTFNLWRKGGYSSKEEDYRWAVLRSLMHPTAYQIFNVLFIFGYQHTLIFLITMPAYVAYSFRNVALQQLDWLAAALFLALLTMETIADQQQWDFYTAKHALISKKQSLTGDYRAGFNRSGLFQYSRHPNFFAEQSQWCVFYVFSVSSSGVMWNPSIIGAVLLVCFFQGSTVFTEYVSVGKYPEYKNYQKTVSAQVPWFPSAATKKRVD